MSYFEAGVTGKKVATYHRVTFKSEAMKGEGTCRGCGQGLAKGTMHLTKDGGYPHGPFRLCKECVTKIAQLAR